MQYKLEVIRMNKLAALVAACSMAWMTSAPGSECFAIQDDDRRNACLASLKSDKSYCYKITNAETREGCLAPLKGETFGCFKIAAADARAACLGETKREPSYCYKIQ